MQPRFLNLIAALLLVACPGCLHAAVTPIHNGRLDDMLDGNSKTITNVGNMNVKTNLGVGALVVTNSATLPSGMSLTNLGLVTPRDAIITNLAVTGFLDAMHLPGGLTLTNLVMVTPQPATFTSLTVSAAFNATNFSSGISVTNWGLITPKNTSFTNLTASFIGPQSSQLQLSAAYLTDDPTGIHLVLSGTPLSSYIPLAFSTGARGGRVTFEPGTNDAGLNVGPVTADPASLSDGDLWYRSDTGTLKAQINGATVSLGGVQSGSSLTNIVLSAPADTTFTNLTVTGSLNATNFSNGRSVTNWILATPANAIFTNLTVTGSLNATNFSSGILATNWGLITPQNATFTNLTVTGTATLPSGVQLSGPGDATFTNLLILNTLTGANVSVTNNFKTQNLTITNSLLYAKSPVSGALLVDTDTSGTAAWSSGSGKSPNSWFLQNFNWKEWGLSTGASGDATPYGMQLFTSAATKTIIASGTNMACNNYATSTSSNNASGVFSENALSSAADLQIGWTLAPQTLATQRIFIGITTAGNQNAMVQADTIGTSDFIGFRYSTTAGETTWHIISRDGTTQTNYDTTVTVTTNGAVFYLIGNTGGTSFDFWINGVLVNTITGNFLPRATVGTYATQAVISTQSAAAVNMRLFLHRGRCRSYP
jgi:hypothetical protein